MKISQIAIAGSTVIVAGLAISMIVTNPGQKAYENYASEQLNLYLKKSYCTKISQQEDLGRFLQGYCPTLVDSVRPHLQELVNQNTTRHNYFLFSIYRTELALPSPLPNYNFETVGIFQEFYLYEAEKD